MKNLHDSDKDEHILIRKASCQGELDKKKEIGKRYQDLEPFLHFVLAFEEENKTSCYMSTKQTP